MNQNVIDNNLIYQEILILAYFKSHYKKYEFSEIVQIMGMTYLEMRKTIEHLFTLKYLSCIDNHVIIAKKGEEILEENNMDNFFLNKENKAIDRKKLNIEEPYIPINFEM